MDHHDVAIVFDHLNYYIKEYGYQAREIRRRSHENSAKLHRARGFTRETKRNVLAESVSRISMPKFESATYFSRTFNALYDISGFVPNRCLCALIGQRGSGKTTLLKLIAGISVTGKVTGKIGVCSNRIAYVFEVMFALIYYL